MILTINGTSCSGKTSLAKKLIEKAHQENMQALFFSIDTFMREEFVNNCKEENNVFSKAEDNLGYAFSSFHKNIVSAARKNISHLIIVDHCFLHNPIFDNFLYILNNVNNSTNIVMVKLSCSKESAFKRLSERNNKNDIYETRMGPCLENHFKRLSIIHGEKFYDLCIDNSERGIEEESDQVFNFAKKVLNTPNMTCAFSKNYEATKSMFLEKYNQLSFNLN